MSISKTAFVVDNDPTYIGVVKLQLQKSGFKVICFFSVDDFTDNFSSKADLIVLGHNQGEAITGLENLKKIKTINTNLPVLFLIPAKDMHTASQALRYGASFYVEKDNMFFDRFKYALDQLDINKKRKFWSFLRNFRKAVFSLYGF